MVPLVGIMFGNVVSGVTNFLAYKYEMTQALSTWLVGHFSLVLRGRYELVYLVAPLVMLAFLFANHFNIVGMGKDFSKNLGVHYNAGAVHGPDHRGADHGERGRGRGVHLLHRPHRAQRGGDVQGRQNPRHAGGHGAVRRALRAGVRHDRARR